MEVDLFPRMSSPTFSISSRKLIKPRLIRFLTSQTMMMTRSIKKTSILKNSTNLLTYSREAKIILTIEIFYSNILLCYLHFIIQ